MTEFETFLANTGINPHTEEGTQRLYWMKKAWNAAVDACEETLERQEDDEELMRRREFMKLSVEERGKILRKQAEEMASYYEDNKEEIDEFQGGDIIEYE